MVLPSLGRVACRTGAKSWRGLTDTDFFSLLSSWPHLSTRNLFKPPTICLSLCLSTRSPGFTGAPFVLRILGCITRSLGVFFEKPGSAGWMELRGDWLCTALTSVCSSSSRLWGLGASAMSVIFLKDLENTMISLQRKEMTLGLTEAEKNTLSATTSLYNGIFKQQEIYWLGGSALGWIGWRRVTRTQGSFTPSLLSGNVGIPSPPFLHYGPGRFLDYYKSLWGCDHSQGVPFLDYPGPRLDNSLREELLRPIDDDEIWKAIRSLPLNKAPGVDGMSTSFYFTSLTGTLSKCLRLSVVSLILARCLLLFLASHHCVLYS